MKINHTNGTDVSRLGKAQQPGPSSQNGQVLGGRFSGSDQVQLSRLSSALGALGTGSPEHADRLAQLSAVVATGSYQIDSYAVSGSIIQETLAAAGSR